MKPIYIILFFLVISAHSQAQDVIVRNNGDSIHCKIKEVGTTKIKYFRPKFAGQTLFSIAKSDVASIVFENKNMILFDHGPGNRGYEPAKKTVDKSPIDYPITDKKTIIKVNPINIFLGSFELSVERSIKRGVSMEFGAAYIFAYPEDFPIGGFNYNTDGFYLRGGFKFIKSSNSYLHKTANPHILQGFYVKPELIYSQIKYANNYSGSRPSTANNYFCTSFMVNFGKQFVMNNSFSLEWNVGLGIGMSNANYDMVYFGSNLFIEDFPPFYIPLSFTAGFKIGILAD